MNSLNRRLKFVLNRLLYGKESAYYIDLFVYGNLSSHIPFPSEKFRWDVIDDYINKYFLPEFSSNAKILDIGCGRGWMTNYLSKYGEALGIDPVKKVIDYARRLFPTSQFQSIKFEEFNPQYKFDLIVSSEVIEHIPYNEQHEFASSIFSVLNENGVCIISTPRSEIINKNKVSIDQPIENWLTEEMLKELFMEVGFQPIDHQNILIKDEYVYQVWIFKKKQFN